MYRRGRNTAPTPCPRRPAAPSTSPPPAWEALFGWLYLQGRTDRLNELFSVSWSPRSPRSLTAGSPRPLILHCHNEVFVCR